MRENNFVEFNFFLNVSFIFKDDQPVERSEDPEVVNNPQEPIRIEEKVRY